ncbi:MAG TPA: hypothetical protein VL285_00630 [Bryobacteraceae bacterium]|nr:hypothetical protein [Bryobacteraceae bacterium]
MDRKFLVLNLGWLLAAPLLAGEEARLARDGAFWVQTVTGAENLSSSGRLKVSTRGAVTVRGGPEGRVQYTVTKRVKARSESQARLLLRQFQVNAVRQGDMLLLAVAHGGEGWRAAELHVTAPRGTPLVMLETHGGKVDASDLNGSVQVQSGGGGIKLDRIAGPVTARTAGGEITLGSMGGPVQCATAGGPIRAETIRGDATLETAGGDITAGEVGGGLRATTAGGGIRVTRAGGAVSVNTAGGAIEIGSARGMVVAESSSGAIQVGAPGGVQCETGGGGIRLLNASGTLRATTAVGNVIAELLAGGSPEDSMLATGLGDIIIFVPSNLGIRILARTDSGDSKRIVSEFPDVKTKVSGPVAVAEGAINGGGPLFRLSSSGGVIYIRRQK